MMKNKSYPLFMPPNHLATKSAKEWTTKEARAYFEWLLDHLDQRVEAFLEFVDIKPHNTSESLLQDVGAKLERILLHDQFHIVPSDFNKTIRIGSSDIKVASERSLSNEGYAIACDAGLLLAKCLLELGKSKIFWDILKRPRSAQSFNLPILEGFTSDQHLDPIATSLAQAWGVLRQSDKKDRWLKVYEYWKFKV